MRQACGGFIQCGTLLLLIPLAVIFVCGLPVLILLDGAGRCRGRACS